MKISIITVVYNGASTIDYCIESVLGQNYPDIEYIVVDGNSQDRTQEIVESYGSRIAKFISENDHGIYDAMNKGIKLATGDVIGLLNADDYYADTSVIRLVVDAMISNDCDACYGDLEYVCSNDSGKVSRKWISGIYRTDAFLNGWMPPHPTFFVRKAVYDTYGLFRLDLGSASDYELMLRFIHMEKIKLNYIRKVLVIMRLGGVSNSTFKNRVISNFNDRKAWRINGLKPRFYTLLLKPLRKILQYHVA